MTEEARQEIEDVALYEIGRVFAMQNLVQNLNPLAQVIPVQDVDCVWHGHHLPLAKLCHPICEHLNFPAKTGIGDCHLDPSCRLAVNDAHHG